MTKKKIARSKQGTKGSERRAGKGGASSSTAAAAKTGEQPVDAEIRRAAKRARLNENGLAPEEQATVDRLSKDGLPVSPAGFDIVKMLRAKGLSTETIGRALRAQAHDLEALAESLTPSPQVRDEMLTDALAVLDVAESIFEHRGDRSDLVGEALRCAEDDIGLFEYASMSSDGGASEMAYLRAQYRIRLALKLAEFRAKHPAWKPAPAENDDDRTERAAGGAS